MLLLLILFGLVLPGWSQVWIRVLVCFREILGMVLVVSLLEAHSLSNTFTLPNIYPQEVSLAISNSLSPNLIND